MENLNNSTKWNNGSADVGSAHISIKFINFILLVCTSWIFLTICNAATTKDLLIKNIRTRTNKSLLENRLLNNEITKSEYLNHSGLPNHSTITLTNQGSIFTASQVITKLDGQNMFAVGRWDNTIEVINSHSTSYPTLLQTLALRNNNGVQMVAYLDDNTFVSSNETNSLAIWQKNHMNLYKFHKEVSYANSAPNVGIANSGALVNYNGVNYFISGHDNGYIILWKFNGNDLTFIKAVNFRSPNPIPFPSASDPLLNISQIAAWKNGLFVTGSEDGDLVLANVNGDIIYRVKYNQTAQRGINQIQILGDYLLVSNCAVGSNDKNLWLYNIVDHNINYLDSVNLKQDQSLPQVFNFGIAMGQQNGIVLFFASTQEGILWDGYISPENKLTVLSSMTVSPPLGSVLYYDDLNKTLAQSAYDTQIFTVSSSLNTKVIH
jgi:hypothetical protein